MNVEGLYAEQSIVWMKDSCMNDREFDCKNYRIE